MIVVSELTISAVTDWTAFWKIIKFLPQRCTVPLHAILQSRKHRPCVRVKTISHHQGDNKQCGRSVGGGRGRTVLKLTTVELVICCVKSVSIHVYHMCVDAFISVRRRQRALIHYNCVAGRLHSSGDWLASIITLLSSLSFFPVFA